MQHPSKQTRPLRVGELARAVGKSVRAIHLYEELGLLQPLTRTSGGFRLFGEEAIDRINWITKLQAIGFSLTDIQGFVRDFESAQSGRTATARVREVFQEKLTQTRASLAQLQIIENDLVEAIDYLDSCQSCAPSFRPVECQSCEQHGHAPGEAPELFAGLSTPCGGGASARPALRVVEDDTASLAIAMRAAGLVELSRSRTTDGAHVGSPNPKSPDSALASKHTEDTEDTE